MLEPSMDRAGGPLRTTLVVCARDLVSYRDRRTPACAASATWSIYVGPTN
jgi:hypothetical protein